MSETETKERGYLHQRSKDFGKVPQELMHDTEISAGAVRLYAHMHWRYGSNMRNFESQKSMAAMLGVSTKTIARWLKELEAKNWIVIVHRKYQGQYTSNFYHVFERQDDCEKWKSSHRTSMSHDHETSMSDGHRTSMSDKPDSVQPDSKDSPSPNGDGGATPKNAKDDTPSKNGDTYPSLDRAVVDENGTYSPAPDWQPENVFEFVLEKMYDVKYVPRLTKLSKSTRGHCNAVKGALGDVKADLSEVKVAWAAYPDDLARPRSADAWAGMVMRYREGKVAGPSSGKALEFLE